MYSTLANQRAQKFVAYLRTKSFDVLQTNRQSFFSLRTSPSDETLTFAAGATYNISGTWTLTGRDSEDRINLVSGSGGSAWYVNPSGSRSLSVVDVKDSYNLHATAVNVTSGVDSTGNTNWTFDAGGGEAPEFTWWALLMLMLVCGWVLQK